MAEQTREEYRAHLLNTYGYENKQTFGSGGFVFLDDFMGTDSDIARVARVSYGGGTKSVSDDIALVRRLIKDNHTSPLEQLRIRLFIRAPLELIQQMKTHRSFHYFSWNQMSQRYSVAIDECAVVQPDQWRKQSTNNKQGSDGFVTEWAKPDLANHYGWNKPGHFLSHRQEELQDLARAVYEERLDLGVSREQARSDLPLSNYTELYVSCDLHNLLHFLGLRLDPHAQQEIRELAGAIANIVKAWVPATWQAYEDYRLNALTFSAQECAILRELIHSNRYDCLEFLADEPKSRGAFMEPFGITSINERAGFVTKLKQLLGSKDDT